jgi:eukaryotic-like serine/threonine-protein kinase
LTMTSTWNRLEGVSLVRPYLLEEWLGDSGDAAFFRASARPQPARVLVKVVPARADSAAQLELWRSLTRLSHPHLLRLLDCGLAEWEDERFFYAVFEYPDEILSNAGALTEADARETLAAVRDALDYVHSQGLVHTAVDVDHVVAVGNQIKLSSETLRPQSGAEDAESDQRAVVGLAKQLGCAVAVKPREVAAAAVAAEVSRTPSFPKWVLAPALVLLALLGLPFLPKTPPAHVASPAPAPATPASAAPAAPAPVGVPEEPSEYWRVIAYTYNVYRKAEEKARSLNQKWAGASAEVFQPNGRSGPYLVALGGRMSRDEAVRLLRIARGKGLPRDIYIQNYRR